MNTVSARELGVSEFTFGGWLFSLLAQLCSLMMIFSIHCSYVASCSLGMSKIRFNE